MKKLMTLLAVFGLVLALAPGAWADIVVTQTGTIDWTGSTGITGPGTYTDTETVYLVIASSDNGTVTVQGVDPATSTITTAGTDWQNSIYVKGSANVTFKDMTLGVDTRTHVSVGGDTDGASITFDNVTINAGADAYTDLGCTVSGGTSTMTFTNGTTGTFGRGALNDKSGTQPGTAYMNVNGAGTSVVGGMTGNNLNIQLFLHVTEGATSNARFNFPNIENRASGGTITGGGSGFYTGGQVVVEQGGSYTFEQWYFDPPNNISSAVTGPGSLLEGTSRTTWSKSSTDTGNVFGHVVNGGELKIVSTTQGYAFGRAAAGTVAKLTVGAGSILNDVQLSYTETGGAGEAFVLAEMGEYNAADTDMSLAGTLGAGLDFYLVAAPDASGGTYTPFAGGTVAASDAQSTAYGGTYASGTFTPATMGTSGSGTIDLTSGGRAALAGTAVINFATNSAETALGVTISSVTGPTVGAGEEVMGAYDFTAGSYVPADGAILAMYFADLDSDYWNGDKIEVYRNDGGGWAQLTEANEAMISRGWVTLHDGAYQSGYDYAVVKTAPLVSGSPAGPAATAGTLIYGK